MYNEEWKNEYLQTIANENVKQNIASLFKRTENIEAALGKDLCNFNYKNFCYLFETCKFVSSATFATQKSNIKKYVAWCVDNQLCSNNGLSEIIRLRASDLAGLYKIDREFYFSLEELVRTISQVFESNNYNKDYYSRIVMYYSLFWLQFSKEEIHNMKTTDVNFNTNTICAGNYTVNIPGCLQEYIDITANCDFFVSQSGRRRFLVESPYLFRTPLSAKISNNYAGNVVRLWDQLCGDLPMDNEYRTKKLNSTVISQCGMYRKIYEEVEEEGKTVNAANIKSILRDNIIDNTIFVVLDNYKRWRESMNSRPL